MNLDRHINNLKRQKREALLFWIGSQVAYVAILVFIVYLFEKGDTTLGIINVALSGWILYCVIQSAELYLGTSRDLKEARAKEQAE